MINAEDAENKFLPLYTQSGILQDNPFEVLDEKGVGKLMELTVDWVGGHIGSWSAFAAAARQTPSKCQVRDSMGE
jgi:hypothetical protein